MAHYATQDGGGTRSQSMPFGYDPPWLAHQQDQTPFGFSDDFAFNQHQQRVTAAAGNNSILDQHDNSLLGDFFNNPDITNQMAFNFDSVVGAGEARRSDGIFGSSEGLFDLEGQGGMVNDPFHYAATRTLSHGGNYQAQNRMSNSQQPTGDNQMIVHHEYGEGDAAGAEEEDHTQTIAAEGLMGMSTNRPNPSQPMFPHNTGRFDSSSTWGNVGMNSSHAHMHGSSGTGRQSAGPSAHNQTTGNHGQSPAGPFGYIPSTSPQLQPQQGFHSNMHMQQQMYTAQRGRPHSMGDIHAGRMARLPHAEPRSAQVSDPNFGSLASNNVNHYGNTPLRPPLNFPRWGSDEGFGADGYRPPSAYDPSNEKATNLNQVPMADEASANARGRQPPMRQPDPRMLQAQAQARSQNMQGIHSPVPSPDNPTFFNPNQYHGHNQEHPQTPNGAMTIPGATSYGGYGVHPFHGHGHGQQSPHQYYQGSQFSRGSIANRQPFTDEDQESESKSITAESSAEGSPARDAQPARKRRKSDYEPEGEDEYRPPARGARRPNNSTLDGSSDEDTYRRDSSTGKKRPRAHTIRTKSSPSSSGPASPATRPSTAAPRNSAARRRQSGTATARVNLTEEQRRQNHIKSEKNRRELIKTNYTKLQNLVPALKGGKSGFSRSEVLNEILDFVEQLRAGNSHMEDLLLDWTPPIGEEVEEQGTYEGEGAGEELYSDEEDEEGEGLGPDEGFGMEGAVFG